MTTTYTKGLAADFSGSLNPGQLITEVEADPGIIPTCINVANTGDVVDITFTAALSAGEQTTLNGLISAHTPTVSPFAKLVTAGSNNTTATLQVNQTGNRTITLPDATDTLVGLSVSQTLANKKMNNASTEHVDAGDITKVLKFDTSGAGTGTAMTLASAHTGNRTITLPDVTGTVVLENATQTLANKDLSDASVNFVDQGDATKTLSFSLGGATTSTNMTLTSNHTGNRVITLPDVTDTLATLASTQTLTNKTLTSTANDVAAKSLHSATTVVDVVSATAPTVGQVLKATSATAATWQAESGEINTYSTDGGTALTKTKVGVDLPFKGLTATSTKIALASNANDIGIDVTEGNLTLDNLGGTLGVAKGGTGAVTLTQDGILVGAGTGAITAKKSEWSKTVAPSAATDDVSLGYVVGSRWIDTTADKEYVCLDNTDGAAVWLDTTAGAAGGEQNTYSTDGGTALTKTKVGVNLPFKGLTATSTKIALASNANDIGIDVTEGNLTLDNLGGTLGVAKGGTGAVTHTSGNFLVGAGTSAVTSAKVAPAGVVVGTTDTQTLTNKTMTATTNDVAAKSLHSATTVVDVAAATAPTVGQVLTATSATAATWQTASAGALTTVEITATTSTTTTSATYVALNGMTTTPAAATYIVSFSASGAGTDKDQLITVGMFKAGVLINHSERHSHNISGHTHIMDMPVHSQSIVAVNGSETIDMRWKASLGTATMYERCMYLLKVS